MSCATPAALSVTDEMIRVGLLELNDWEPFYESRIDVVRRILNAAMSCLSADKTAELAPECPTRTRGDD